MKSQNEQHHNDATDESGSEVAPVKSVAVLHICPLLNTASDGGRSDRRPKASKQIAAIQICGQGDQSRHQKPRENVIFLVHNRYELVGS